MVKDKNVGAFGASTKTFPWRDDFKKSDDWIKEHLDTLTCRDLAEGYWTYLDEARELRSTREGLTGFSEFLFFRAIWHHLDGGFKPIPVDNSDSPLVYCRDRDNLTLGQSTQIKLPNGKARKPDIWVARDQNGQRKYRAVIQVKTYATSGYKTLTDEIERLEPIHELPGKPHCALVVFFPSGPDSDIPDLLEEEEGKHEWLSCLLLGQQDTKRLRPELNRCLTGSREGPPI